jgi:hypothetical protein
VALYGKQLAKQVPDSTTGHQARAMYGSMTASLGNAYAVLATYQASEANLGNAVGAVGTAATAGTASGLLGWLGLKGAQALDAGSVEAAQAYLDDCNGFLQEHYPQMPAIDDALTDQQMAWLRADVSTSSTACQQIDQMFGTSVLGELSDSICEAAGTVGAAVASTVSKAAGFGGSFLANFVGGMWWLILIGIAGLVLYSRTKAAVIRKVVA